MHLYFFLLPQSSFSHKKKMSLLLLDYTQGGAFAHPVEQSHQKLL